MANTSFNTSIINLNTIKDWEFSIPTYQRPYVWGQVEVNKLISDFYKTFELDAKQPYYIGTILTKEDGLKADLIDGQQRFTTLWMIAFVFKKKNVSTKLIQFLKNQNHRLKLGFEIRKEVELYLRQLLGETNKEELEISTHEIKNLPYLKNVAEGLTTIENIIDQLDEDKLEAFGDYIFQQVLMIKNRTPEKIDLNHLFATINSSGVQLEQTDIVKSNLLKVLGSDKVLYSKIWEVCENMNNFFERNARASFNESNWNNLDLTKFISFDSTIFKYKAEANSSNSGDDFFIENILNTNTSLYQPLGKEKKIEARDSEEVNCRSIINFAQLLLHTYRLHLHNEKLADFEGTFHVNRLIEIFSELEKRNNKEEVKRFFHLLWEVRYIFDKYVIKWVSDMEDKTEHLELVNINRNIDSYYPRTSYKKSGSLMLQSVLYFTGDYLRQFWLTPFLGFLLKYRNLEPNGNQVLEAIESIDNQLSLCTTQNDKDASFQLLSENLAGNFNIEKYFERSDGCSFKHYWFQKLEYILWKNWNDVKDPKFDTYRITSKNSIEHIYPQHPQLSPEIDKNYLDNFGNLVLLSVSQNSEYSNKEVNVKQSEFKNKATYDTLKSYYIFQFPFWNPDTINSHKEDMVNRILCHYNSTSLLFA
jgi:uncharacterized protein with ParB-like and HNH nuclease domain